LAQKIYEQRYLHRTLREAIVKLIAPDFKKGHTFTTDFFGMKWVGKTNSNLDFQVLLRGAYEKFMLFFMRDVILKSDGGREVLDIGANVGNHALYLSRFASRVHAFEPYKPARDSLEEKIALNNVQNILVYPIGLSDRKESIPYYPTDDILGTGSFQKNFFEQDRESSVNLEVDTGDSVVEDQNISGIDLIKIDVEGFEVQVLKGLFQTLEINRPVVIFETLADTRESNETNYSKMRSMFPEKYSFYEFSKRDKKVGRYSIVPVKSFNLLKSNDIVAVPDEKLGIAR
jgi:FkbM family methyltransferase